MGVLVPSESYRITGQGAGGAKNSGIFDSLLYARLYLYAFPGECLIFSQAAFFMKRGCILCLKMHLQYNIQIMHSIA